MSVGFTDYAQHANTTVTVSNSSQLNSALANLAGSGGGTIYVDPNGGPYDLNANGIGDANSPVKIEPLGSGTPTFGSMTITNSEYITVTGMHLDSSGTSGRNFWEKDLHVDKSDHIQIVDNTFNGNASGFLTEASGGQPAQGVSGVTGARIDDSSNILMSGNLFTNHFNSVTVNDATNLMFDGNEITAFQGDGIHAGGLINSQISNNYLHDPLGSTSARVHSDLIQIFGQNMNNLTDGLVISGNYLDTGAGGAAQGIHISNAAFGTGNQYDGYFNDIDIIDNVIHTSAVRGIGVNNVTELDVHNNTVLWNSASASIKYVGAAPTSYQPSVLVYSSPSADITGNVAKNIKFNNQQVGGNNQQIDYNNPSSPNYHTNHINNLDSSGDANSYDLGFVNSSPIYGNIGASASSGGTTVVASAGSSAPTVSQPVASVVLPADPNSAPVISNDVTPPPSGGGEGSQPAGSAGGETSGGEQVSVLPAAPVGSSAPEAGGASESDEASESGTTTKPQVQPSSEGSGSSPAAWEQPVVQQASAQPATESGSSPSGNEGGAPESGTAAPQPQPQVLPSSEGSGTSPAVSEQPVAQQASAQPSTESGNSSSGNESGASQGEGPQTAPEIASVAPAEDDDDGNFFSKFFKMIIGIFGGGDDSAPAAPVVPATPRGKGAGLAKKVASLEEMVPVTGWLDEQPAKAANDDDEDEDDVSIAA